MADPIPVSRAFVAVEALIKLCDASETEPIHEDCDCNTVVNPRCVQCRYRQAASATLKPLAEYLRGALQRYGDTLILERDYIQTSVAAIVAHLDATQPGWDK